MGVVLSLERCRVRSQFNPLNCVWGWLGTGWAHWAPSYGVSTQVKLSKRGVVGGTFGAALGLIDVLPGRAMGLLT